MVRRALTRFAAWRRRPQVAGVRLRVAPSFPACAIAFAILAAIDVARTTFIELPVYRTIEEAVLTFEPGGTLTTVTHPSPAWVVAGGLAVALVYALSVLVHALGHVAAARWLGLDVVALRVDGAGGFVTTAGGAIAPRRRAALAAAGPLANGLLALLAAGLLLRLGWPLTTAPEIDSGAWVVAGRALSALFLMNAAGFVVNLVPLRPLDGAQLLAAVRPQRVRRLQSR